VWDIFHCKPFSDTVTVSCYKDLKNGWIMLFWSSREERYYERVELHPVGHDEMLAFHTANNLNQSA